VDRRTRSRLRRPQPRSRVDCESRGALLQHAHEQGLTSRGVKLEELFEVKDGKVVPGSYQASPNHWLLTADGFFRLGSFLNERLQQELATWASEPA
jgi:hypothetical protein